MATHDGDIVVTIMPSMPMVPVTPIVMGVPISTDKQTRAISRAY